MTRTSPGFREDGTCVVFDLDGVIVASEYLWEEGWRQVAHLGGVDWAPEDTRACQGKSVPEWADYLAQRAGLPATEARDRVVGYVTDAYESGQVLLLPGAEEMVRGAAHRCPVGMATSAPREVIDRVLAFPELADCFTVTVSSAEVARGKPSPDVYAAAIAGLGADPAKSFAVEDSSNGVRAAAAAGLRVLAIEHAQYPIAADARALAASVHFDLGAVAVALFDGIETGATS